jgi:hypothetical protein
MPVAGSEIQTRVESLTPVGDTTRIMNEPRSSGVTMLPLGSTGTCSGSLVLQPT